MQIMSQISVALKMFFFGIVYLFGICFRRAAHGGLRLVAYVTDDGCNLEHEVECLQM